MQYALTHLWDMIWFMAVVFMFLAYLMAPVSYTHLTLPTNREV